MSQDPPKTTAWQSGSQWYDEIVGLEGHYFHRHVVIPGILHWLEPHLSTLSLLDLACGQGVLERALPKTITYHGIDLAPSLIKRAEELKLNPKHQFSVGDITKPLPLKKGELFSHCAIVLALQNVEHAELALKQAALHLKEQGELIIVLNHPCFRIPRQSHWGIDEKQKLQYRRVDRYLSPLKIPIQTNPGKGEKSKSSWSFHRPLSDYCRFLSEAGFVIADLAEWISDKQSTGKSAKMENRAREEFPLFLAIRAIRDNKIQNSL